MKLTTIDGKIINIDDDVIVWNALYYVCGNGLSKFDSLTIEGSRGATYKVTKDSFFKAVHKIRPRFA